MNNMKLWIRRFYLVCYDFCAVIVASVLALMVRFDFAFSKVPKNYLDMSMQLIGAAFLITVLIFAVFRLYTSLWSYAGATELMYICCACLLDAVLFMVYVLLFHNMLGSYPLPRSFYFLYGIFMLVFTVFGRYMYRAVRMLRGRMSGDREERKNVLIVGAGSAGKGHAGHHVRFQ